MKNFMITLAFVFSFLAGAAGMSVDAFAAKKSGKIPLEVSALLASPEYSKIFREQENIAQSSGLLLRVSSFDVLKIESETYAYLFLATKVAADFSAEWIPRGSIAARIVYDQMGVPTTDAVFFKPGEDFPGGSSVGNN